MKALTYEATRRVYDRIGRLQELQGFYEDRLLEDIVAHSRIEDARAVFEFGCGTGRFAESLLARHLTDDATYRGIDLSPVMVGLTNARLARFGSRAIAHLTEGPPPREEPTTSCDRFFSHCVLDVLPDDDGVVETIAEAHRLVRPGGRAGFCCMTYGFTAISRAFVTAWLRVRDWRPGLVGGTRPLDLRSFLPERQWRVCYQVRVVRGGVPIQGVVAERI